MATALQLELFPDFRKAFDLTDYRILRISFVKDEPQFAPAVDGYELGCLVLNC